ncbi:MerR family transcriptional regulator [Actinomadura welshii]
MRIGEVAGATGVSRRLLRYYEEQGLLRPVRRANGYREYSASDVATVRHVRALLSTGLPTAAIARLLHCVHDEDGRMVPSPCPAMIGELRRERARVTEALGRLEASRRAIDSMLASAQRRGR